jgi:transketolase
MGLVQEEELTTYRRLGSRLAGHEDMDLVPGIDATPSGSLGMVLSYGVGSAIASKHSGIPYNTFTFIGDGEEQEGNISEAARHASHLGLDNLIAIIDRNKKQLHQPCDAVDSGSNLEKIWEGYGWIVLNTNGHDFDELKSSYIEAIQNDRPTLIIADSIKGNGLPGALDSKNGYHTVKSFKKNLFAEAYDSIQQAKQENGLTKTDVDVFIKARLDEKKIDIEFDEPIKLPEVHVQNTNDKQLQMLFSVGDFLEEYIELCREKGFRVYSFNPDNRHPPQFDDNLDVVFYSDVGIREQHMVALAHGVCVSDINSKVFLFNHDAFTYRCADQLKVLTQGQSDVIYISLYSGLSGRRNGMTHQSTGESGMILNMPGIKFFEPSDVNDFFYALNKSVNGHGPSYIRLHRDEVGFTPSSENEHSGVYEVGNHVENPSVIVFSSGLITPHAHECAKRLNSEGIATRLINVVEFDSENDFISQFVDENTPVFTFYNGVPNVLGGHVAQHLVQSGIRNGKFKSFGFDFGRTGTIKDLLHDYKLDGQGIYDQVKENI